MITNKELDEEREAEEYLNNLENSKEKPMIISMLIYAVQVLLVTVFVYFNLGTALIDGNSMNPTFLDGEKAFLHKTAYLFSDGDYGDIVAFRPAEGYPSVFCKRLIGKPGDSIEIKNNVVYRNGEALIEPYLNEPMQTDDMESLELKNDEYFFMGDNRNHSSDSRYIGAIDKSLIVGELITFWK